MGEGISQYTYTPMFYRHFNKGEQLLWLLLCFPKWQSYSKIIESASKGAGARFTKHLKPKIFVSPIQFVWDLRKS